MSTEKYVTVKVLVEKEFLIPIHSFDDQDIKKSVSMINGWTLEQVLEDWFETHAKTIFHATRDSFEIRPPCGYKGVQSITKNEYPETTKSEK